MMIQMMSHRVLMLGRELTTGTIPVRIIGKQYGWFEKIRDHFLHRYCFDFGYESFDVGLDNHWAGSIAFRA
jgi:hypothetical protein